MRAQVLLLATGLLYGSSPVDAKKNDPYINLEFRPTQTVGATEVNIVGPMLDRAVSIRFEDDRRGEPADLGSRTDDDDRVHDLQATTDVIEFIERNFVDSAERWGIRVDPEESFNLRIRVLEFSLEEDNQAVGAMYTATVRFAYSIHDGEGESKASSAKTGSASRYGKKFSTDNTNEVLSDALLDVAAQLLSDPVIQKAWAE